MRILCLHGFRTSAKILEEQLKPLMRRLPSTWEFTFLNAPNSATGEPDESIKIAFPQFTELFEWYNWRKLDDGTLEYDNGFETSMEYLKKAILASNYDILLGFSQVSFDIENSPEWLLTNTNKKQGGLMVALLTVLCERGLMDIPSHRRWKFSVLLNAPFPRGNKYTIDSSERWCTPSLFVFGNKDKLIDPTKWKLPNAISVFTEEAHALPRLPESVSAVSQAILKMTERVWFAFDFDGVVCDSARETAITAWMASAGIIETADGVTPPSEDVIANFCKARPLLETGFEAIVIMYRLCVLKEDPMVMLESPHPIDDMKQALNKMGYSEEVLKERFQKSREGWIAKDENGWLVANGFYAPTVEAMKRLIAERISIYVVTTKHASFAKKLLLRQGVELPDDRIFGLGSGKKREVITTISREREAVNGGSCIFIEDRIETLRDVAKHASFPSTLVVAGYGYNTENEREQAQSRDGFVVFNTSEQLNYWIRTKIRATNS
jgi:hypothetical protein